MPNGMRSIRLIFSIADIQTEPEAEFEEGEEGAEESAEDADAPLHSYPIRCSFSFTKVRSRPQLFEKCVVLTPAYTDVGTWGPDD